MIEKITTIPDTKWYNEHTAEIDGKAKKINEIINKLNILIEEYNKEHEETE